MMFQTQEEVDKYVLETEKIAENTNDKESATKLYQHIVNLRNVEEDFFVPYIVLSWEEMALSFMGKSVDEG